MERKLVIWKRRYQDFKTWPSPSQLSLSHRQVGSLGAQRSLPLSCFLFLLLFLHCKAGMTNLHVLDDFEVPEARTK